LGDKPGALEDYTQAIRLNSNSSVAYSSRGDARRDLGDNAGAIKDYTDAIRLNPKNAFAYYGRGLTNAALENKPEAIEDLQQAARLFLDNGRIAGYNDAQFQIKKLQQ
jgi:tetratricopeptide (TPR) repeat protein